MIQPIYTSVSDANIQEGTKGQLIKSTPIPLLRDNYLKEYRTELERAKVRKNLGIADTQSLLWGSIDGTIEEQKDLIQYVEQKSKYTNDLLENVTTVKEALDYSIFFISQYKSNSEDVKEIKQNLETIKDSIITLEDELGNKINTNKESIDSIIENITNINNNIININQSIENIDVDKNILNWITENLKNSQTIKIQESLEVIISENENNSIQVSNGLYVKNLEPDLETTKQNILDIQSIQEETTSKINENSTSILNIQNELESINVYQTDLPDNTVSTVLQGTTVEKLRGKQFNEILDTILFPTVVRDLVYPQLYYSISTNIVEVGEQLLQPTLVFVQNDAGQEISRQETINYNGTPVESNTYNSIGIYTYTGNVEYEAGEYLINNKGEVTDKRIEAGSIQATTQITATYPWYVGNTDSIIKQVLIPFNQQSGIITFLLTGKAVIKLPGSNTQLHSFTVDGGLGYLDIDLNGWDLSTEEINGFTYKVWTKKDSYQSTLSHQINFTLSQ